MASTMRKVKTGWSMRLWDSSWRKYWDSGSGGNVAYVRLALQVPRPTLVLMRGGGDGEHPTSLGLLFTLASGPGRSKMQSNPACLLALPLDFLKKRPNRK